MKTKALYLTVALATMLGFSSCKMDFVPGDELSSEILLQDPKGAEYIMDGCYAVLKDEVEFLGYSWPTATFATICRCLSSPLTTSACPLTPLTRSMRLPLT